MADEFDPFIPEYKTLDEVLDSNDALYKDLKESLARNPQMRKQADDLFVATKAAKEQHMKAMAKVILSATEDAHRGNPMSYESTPILLKLAEAMAANVTLMAASKVSILTLVGTLKEVGMSAQKALDCVTMAAAVAEALAMDMGREVKDHADMREAVYGTTQRPAKA